MTNDIADIIKSKIEGLPFVDRLAGLVKVLTISEETDLGKKRKSFPVACNVSASECNNISKLKDLTPDSSKRSVMYFEEFGGTVMTGTDRNYLLFRSSVRLVCWLNLKKMGLTDCGWSSTAVLSIMKELSSMTQPANYNNKYIQLQVKQINEAEKSPLIFSKYTYDEASNQYLIYPYDYFAINITVEFKINANCIDPLEIPDLPLCDDNVTPNPNTPTVGTCWDLLRWDCDKQMWVRLAAPTEPGNYVITVASDGSLSFTQSSGGGGSASNVVFNTTAEQYAYDDNDIPALANITATTLTLVMMDGSRLIPSQFTWNKPVFVIDSDVMVNGDESIVIIQ